MSEGFAQWLERMLEPDYEERFASARESLAALTAPAVLTATPSNDQPEFLRPLGSKVKLIRDGDLLSIYIPPAGINAGIAPVFGFALFWNGFCFFGP
ncbi:MAG: hypothetical protein HC919_12410 [Oscillatoriales cyanobacterium SM2_2_1]|nr:hypothetical protein [Oscillatoriales cyanobacterium SM2_2_1]